MTAQLVHTVEVLVPGHCAFCTEVAGQPVVPADPESLDATRPADLDVCHVCGGAGAITYTPPADPAGEFDETCRSCGGTGTRGAA